MEGGENEAVIVFKQRYHDYACGLYEFTKPSVIEWRMKGRMRTVSVALVLCLNIGVDPPDLVKPQPCARLECWVDPSTLPLGRALPTIGNRLQEQYERWQPRARYVQSLDQTVDDIRKLCVALRRSSKQERILFHYNGHGVPKPTSNGEIWVFNKNYTQYIPLSIFDLTAWLSSPSIYVFDCNSAGVLTSAFATYENQRNEAECNINNDTIILIACAAGEMLPIGPELGVADVFTSCLLTPIEMALRWFICCTVPFLRQVTYDQIDLIPGKFNDRKTPVGELNWIFTAITDSIAWSSLPCQLFQRLFRQDLLVASQFRNYLLACRVMQSLGCHPQSHPALPQTTSHPMWQQWDLIAQWAIGQLHNHLHDPEHNAFQSSTFFTEQLTAFEVWLEFASEDKKPMQLPVVLQVLLSQAHRLRALQLLARFVDMGPWAVSLSLSVGIFPYVLKLLQSPTQELKNILVFIWCKIIAVDQSCQRELVKDHYHLYFLTHVSSSSSLQRSMALFILASITDSFTQGQAAVLNGSGLTIFTQGILSVRQNSPLFRQLCLICLGKLWELNGVVRDAALRHQSPNESVVELAVNVALNDHNAMVRAAAVFAIGLFLMPNHTMAMPLEPYVVDMQLDIVRRLCPLMADGSALVRHELVFAIAALVEAQKVDFSNMAHLMSYSESSEIFDADSNYDDRVFIWKVVLTACRDPILLISQTATSLHSVIRPCHFVRSMSGQIISADDANRSVHRSASESGLSEYRSQSSPLMSDFFQYVRELFLSGSCKSPDAFVDDDESQYIACHQQSCSHISDHNQVLRSKKCSSIDEKTFHTGQSGELNNNVALFASPLDAVNCLVLHPYEPMVVSADASQIAIFDFASNKLVANFGNENSSGHQITSMLFMNPSDISLLCVGSDDGVVRIWKHPHSDRHQLVSAWHATTCLKRGHSPGLILDWQQAHSRLLCSGGGDVLRVWDVNAQMAIGDINLAHVESNASYMCTNRENIVFTGHDNGQLRVSDLRTPSEQSTLVFTHESQVISVFGQSHNPSPLLASASSRGDIRISDLRMYSRTIRLFQANQQSATKSDTWSNFAASNCGNVYAFASIKHFVEVGSLSGYALNSIRYYDGFLGQRIGSVSSLAFHPRYPLLAVGCTDRCISLLNDGNPISRQPYIYDHVS
uniref:Raptor N-terminal CASPase-like domain-containing protein n=1 Tax=Spongospora subterranea TaxID=70186 RepID=A0A0H5RPD0_9EUKA|eukprot:CRZ10579.1 hypothetical protein [Spongospora subterranea]